MAVFDFGRNNRSVLSCHSVMAELTRRALLGSAAITAASTALGGAAKQSQMLFAKSEVQSGPYPQATPPDGKIGFAVVGLGELATKEIMPAIGRTKSCKLTALVTGDPTGKGAQLAREYGVPATSVYDYSTYDKLKDNPEVDVIYIVLPNSMHAEYTIRGAKSGKNILCEKPMATSSADCEKMIAACKEAQKWLMIAYRQQYEPLNRAALRMSRDGTFGAIRTIEAINGQNQGDPTQWRQSKRMAGGGSLVDVGIYCLNFARFITGEEPEELWATDFSDRSDPRFKEVEDKVMFTLKFPSGVLAQCQSFYSGHKSARARINCETGWIDLDPNFIYSGLSLKTGKTIDNANQVTHLQIDQKDQFATEMDHMATCIKENRKPHTPGEEGLQDQRLIEAIYRSIASGRSEKLQAVSTRDTTRGPDPVGEK